MMTEVVVITFDEQTLSEVDTHRRRKRRRRRRRRRKRRRRRRYSHVYNVFASRQIYKN